MKKFFFPLLGLLFTFALACSNDNGGGAGNNEPAPEVHVPAMGDANDATGPPGEPREGDQPAAGGDQDTSIVHTTLELTLSDTVTVHNNASPDKFVPEEKKNCWPD